MSLAIAATVFAVIFPAELPDKTALASLLLGSRYRPLYVFAGVGTAFALHVGLAIAAGSALALLPHRPLEIVVAALFALGAVLALWAVAALAIAGGRGLLKLIPLTWVTRIAAAIMLVLAGISLAAAFS